MSGSALRLSRLARSSTLRLVAAIVAVFLAAAAVLAALVWTSVSAHVERSILDTIRTDVAGLEAVWRDGGTAALARAVDLRRGETGPDGHRRVHVVVSAEGDKIAGDFDAFPNDVAPDGETVRFRDPAGTAYSGIVRRIAGGPDLLVAHDRAEHEAAMARLARELALPIVAALVVALAVAVLVGGRLIDRVERVNATARAVEAGDLSARVVMSGDDEFGRLAAHVNAMLDRIEALVGGVHHLSDQIAHETRTPLARLRARLERARREAEADPASRGAVSAFDDAIAEAAELIAVFSALLDIARTEAAAGDARGLARVDLAGIVADVVDLYEAVAEDRGVTIAVEVVPAVVLGERTALTRMLANLVDNAVKFSAPGGAIDVGVAVSGSSVSLVVRDRGPGLPDGFETRAFERFTRAEATADVPGHGLGLPFVRAVALRHGMRISLERVEPGLRVVVRGEIAEG